MHENWIAYKFEAKTVSRLLCLSCWVCESERKAEVDVEGADFAKTHAAAGWAAKHFCGFTSF